MRAVVHGFKPDRIQGPPLAVAQEFVRADRRKKRGKLEALQYRGRERRGR